MIVIGQLHVQAALLPRKLPLVPIEHDTGRAPEVVFRLWRRYEAVSNISRTLNAP
jgi:hypothetical protein